MFNKATLKTTPVVPTSYDGGESHRLSRNFVNKVEELNKALYRALNSQFEVKF